MQQTKVRVSISFILLVIIMLIGHQFLLFINYMMALVFHEMAHIYMAKSKGYNATTIKLDMLGASVKLDNRIQKDDLFVIAFAGPAINFIICLICTSLWWIIPETYVFTAEFFRCNLLIASFNMLPVQPLDGAKILDSVLSKHNQKISKIVNLSLNIFVVALFIILFIISCFNIVNLTYLLFAIFFASNFLPKRKVNFDVYYKLFFKKNKKIEKINFLHVQPTCTLIEMLKQTREGYYTIFYLELNNPIYITEKEFNILLTKNTLTDTIKQALKK
ncbi:MAG: metalloprotease [Clostridia bacterium]